MTRQTQFQFWYVILALLGIVLIRDLWVTAETTMPIPYSQFESYLQENAIDEVVIGSEKIRGTFKVPQEGKTAFVTSRTV